MSNLRDTNHIANSSLYRININSTFLKPKFNEPKLQISFPSSKASELSSQTPNKFIVNNLSALSSSKRCQNKEVMISFDDLFNSLKEKLSKNEVLKTSLMKFNPSEIYKTKLECCPIKIKIPNEKLQFNSEIKYLNKKRQTEFPINLNEMTTKVNLANNDLLKKVPFMEFNSSEIAKKEETFITNNYYFDKNNELMKKNGDLQTPIKKGNLNESSNKDGKVFDIVIDDVLKKCEALLSCLSINGFTYKMIITSKKFYIEIMKRGSKLRYSMEVDRSTLLILLLEETNENQLITLKCQNIDLEKFIKILLKKKIK